MTHIGDNLRMGSFSAPGVTLTKTLERDPTANQGIGPLGRIYVYDIVPATLSTTNIAAAQAPANGVGMALVAGAGITAMPAPDGSGATVYAFDVPRAVSLTTAGGNNLSAINFLITGYDRYARKMTQLQAGPNANTVNTLKAFASVLSIVPQGTSVLTLSAGSSDIFGLPYVVTDAGYVINASWNNTLADNAGTLVNADLTSPPTNLTGDVCGTYAQAGAASNGTRRLVVTQAMSAAQVGTSATLAANIGAAQA